MFPRLQTRYEVEGIESFPVSRVNYNFTRFEKNAEKIEETKGKLKQAIKKEKKVIKNKRRKRVTATTNFYANSYFHEYN